MQSDHVKLNKIYLAVMILLYLFLVPFMSFISYTILNENGVGGGLKSWCWVIFFAVLALLSLYALVLFIFLLLKNQPALILNENELIVNTGFKERVVPWNIIRNYEIRYARRIGRGDFFHLSLLADSKYANKWWKRSINIHTGMFNIKPEELLNFVRKRVQA